VRSSGLPDRWRKMNSFSVREVRQLHEGVCDERAPAGVAGERIEGMWTPGLNTHTGYCEYNCTLCGQVCPTGAIPKLPLNINNTPNWERRT